jgi:hypothetical protein
MNRRFAAATAVAVLAVSAPLFAGSQLLCRRYEIGTEASLPWTQNQWWGMPAPSYPREKLVADTLALLTPDRSVIVRMETLRRAAEYARDRELAQELVAALMARVLSAESKKSPDALAWFDAGYLSATYELSGRGTPVAGLDGYAWVTRALELRPNAEMQFAAALIRRESPDKPGAHIAAAYEGATPGSLLARNLTVAFGDKRPVRTATTKD